MKLCNHFLPYKICSSLPRHHFEAIYTNPPKSFPHSVLLEMTVPYDKRDVSILNRSFILISTTPPAQFRFQIFPTRAAFLGSMIGLYLDPPSGRVQTRGDRLLSVWMSYFIIYTLRNLRRVLPNGDLKQEHAEVLQSLKPENQPFFDTYVRSGTRVSNRFVLSKARKDVLVKKLGYASWLHQCN